VAQSQGYAFNDPNLFSVQEAVNGPVYYNNTQDIQDTDSSSALNGNYFILLRASLRQLYVQRPNLRILSAFSVWRLALVPILYRFLITVFHRRNLTSIWALESLV
jgi:hypothetical protein